MKYKIIEINSDDHSIVVRFYTDKVTEADLAVQSDEKGAVLRARTDFNIDLPVPPPAGVALERLILRYAPMQWLDKREAIADPMVDTSLAFLLPLLGVEQSASIENDPRTVELEVEAVAVGVADRVADIPVAQVRT